jgi:hypothetical protein
LEKHFVFLGLVRFSDYYQEKELNEKNLDSDLNPTKLFAIKKYFFIFAFTKKFLIMSIFFFSKNVLGGTSFYFLMIFYFATVVFNIIFWPSVNWLLNLIKISYNIIFFVLLI